MINKIHNMDCLEGMRQMESESVDLVLTDPPYNVLQKTQEWDNKGSEEEFMNWTKQMRLFP